MEYRNLIWTNHILQRMKERNLSYDDVYWVFSKPEEIKESKAQGGKKFSRNYKGKWYTIVAKKNEKSQWVLLTCWEKDERQHKDRNRKHGKKYNRRNIGFWKNLWEMITGK
jgi:hypothetical protein